MLKSSHLHLYLWSSQKMNLCQSSSVSPAISNLGFCCKKLASSRPHRLDRSACGLWRNFGTCVIYFDKASQVESEKTQYNTLVLSTHPNFISSISSVPMTQKPPKRNLGRQRSMCAPFRCPVFFIFLVWLKKGPNIKEALNRCRMIQSSNT